MSEDSLLYKTFPLKGAKIVYEKHITIDSISKEDLLLRAKEWMTNNVKDTNQVEDKEAGRLNSKGSVVVMFKEPDKKVAAEWNCNYMLQLTCQDNEVTAILTDLEQATPSGYGSLNIVKVEALKNKTDSLPPSVFFGKNNKERYWNAELVALKEIDHQIKTQLASLETALRQGKKEQ